MDRNSSRAVDLRIWYEKVTSRAKQSKTRAETKDIPETSLVDC